MRRVYITAFIINHLNIIGLLIFWLVFWGDFWGFFGVGGWDFLGFFGIIYSLLKNSLVTERVRKKKLRNFSKKFRGGLSKKFEVRRKNLNCFFLFFDINLTETPIFVHTFSKPHIFVSHIQQRIFWTWKIKGKTLLIVVIIDPSLSTAFIRNERVIMECFFKSGELVIAANWSYFFKAFFKFTF